MGLQLGLTDLELDPVNGTEIVFWWVYSYYFYSCVNGFILLFLVYFGKLVNLLMDISAGWS